MLPAISNDDSVCSWCNGNKPAKSSNIPLRASWNDLQERTNRFFEWKGSHFSQMFYWHFGNSAWVLCKFVMETRLVYHCTNGKVHWSTFARRRTACEQWWRPPWSHCNISTLHFISFCLLHKMQYMAAFPCALIWLKLQHDLIKPRSLDFPQKPAQNFLSHCCVAWSRQHCTSNPILCT